MVSGPQEEFDSRPADEKQDSKKALPAHVARQERVRRTQHLDELPTGEWINMQTAMGILEVSRPTLRKLISEGFFTVRDNVLDKRETLLDRAEVAELATYLRRGHGSALPQVNDHPAHPDTESWQARTRRDAGKGRSPG